MLQAWRDLSDERGPKTIALLRHPSRGDEAIVVVDDVTMGPAIGGVRMATDLSVGEVVRLARAMTLKNAVAGLRHGGAKAGIIPASTRRLASNDEDGELEDLFRWFARAIEPLVDYTPGPDMGTNERCMAWIHDEIRRAVGLPRAIGGIPLDEIGATGFGLAVCADVLASRDLIALPGARFTIQGFGAVGIHAARFLTARGALVVGVSDRDGAVVNPTGLDVAALADWKRARNGVARFAGGVEIPREDLLTVDADVFIPAARPDVIRVDNAHAVKAHLILPGANIPVAADAEPILLERGIVLLPDFIANAGGVICAATEYAGGTETEAFAVIEERITENLNEVLDRADAGQVPPRAAAIAMATERLAAAAGFRRFH